MTSFNLFKSKTNIPNYSKSEILEMTEEQLINLSKIMGMKTHNSKNIIEILKYLHKLKQNPNCVLFDEATYDAGRNWCYFYIRCKNIVAKFRMLFDEDIIWDFFKFIDCYNLKVALKSDTRFNYGSNMKGIIKLGDKIDQGYNVPDNFQWLDGFYTQYGRSIYYIGVEFYNAV